MNKREKAIYKRAYIEGIKATIGFITISGLFTAMVVKAILG